MHESRLFYSSPRSSFSEFRGMTLSWDSIEWLKDNFSVQDVVVGFYIVGKYSPSQQRFAEAEFQDSVKRLVQVGSREAAEWATSTIANDYEILRKKDVLSFWKKATSEEAQALETNQSNEWTIKFYQAADFQGKGKGKGRAAPQLPNPPPPATRLEQQQADGVYVAGLGNSIGTYIRAVAEGQVTHYDQATQRGKYFICAGMNGVLDLTDVSEGSQLSTLTKDQQDELKGRFPPPSKTTDVLQENVAGILEKEKRQELGELHPDVPWPVVTLELHHLEPEYFIPGILHLSEADYVAKIWAPVLEILFRGTKAWCHWGDTLSEADNKLSFRMDLRILCRTVESNDACDGELGREISTQKYYHDKIKLILNGLHQLHDINNKCKMNDTSIFLVHILGFEACLYALKNVADGLYVLNLVTTFNFPTTRGDIAASVTEFIDALTLLKGTEDNDPVRRMWNRDLAACLNFIHINRGLRVSGQVPETFRRAVVPRRRRQAAPISPSMRQQQ
ncbi:hypothetical protein BX666DRAFT_2026742 [Dichotomocladium elegans]|nr:hypothetical protein BX666DRAFT_2026742 [Dichotomocladium elegans]